MNINSPINDTEKRRAFNKQVFEDQDSDLCVLCHAYGPDKRGLVVRCFYAIHEFIPEVLDVSNVEGFQKNDYYLRVCKVCRSGFLVAMEAWRNERVALQGEPKDSDGGIGYDEYEGGMIPVRIAGATVMLTPNQYEEYKLRMLPSESPTTPNQ